MTEVWKDIEGYEGYQVSNFGRVRSFKYRKIRFLKYHKSRDGYLLVCLCKKGKQKTFYIHRLVAEAFISNPLNLTDINHKDEDKTNNFVGTPENDYTDGNLEWCDHKYNINYGTHNERVSKTLINGSLSKKVLQYSIDGFFIKEWESVHEIKRQLGYNVSNICECCRGERNKVKGYNWKYK